MLLTQNDQKTIDELTTQLCMFERNLRQSKNSEKFSQEALLAKTDNQKQGSNANSSKKGPKKEDQCHYCKKKGHWVNNCRKWIAAGRPPKNKANNNAQNNEADANVALFSICNEVCEIETNSTDWWVDNGATRHVTNRPEFFMDFKEFKSPSGIKAAGKESLKALGQGTVQVLSRVNDKVKKLTLTNVWYVPQISKNLFSVLAAQDKKTNSKFESTVTKCWLEVDGTKVLCGVRETNGTLYKALIQPVTPQKNIEINTAEANISMLQLYHERWGHQDKQHVRKMIEKEEGIKVKAVKGYLVGYDGDERYRIYLADKHKVVLSRDVIFQETPKDCEERVSLPLQDVTAENQEREEKQSDRELNGESEVGSDSENEEENLQPPTGRQLRDRSTLRKPKCFEDYVTTAEAFVSETEAPETFEDALKSKQSAEWRKAMNKEMDSLLENQTWEKAALPQGEKAIPCKWIFRLKTNPDGSIDKYKARVVVKGFSQRQGIDYSQTFSPVARMGTVRSMLSIAASEQMHLVQFDVSTAFLYGELEEVIYMRQPEGYEDGTTNVCKLKRSLYGLKQAPRCWHKRFGNFLVRKGFKISEADPCLFIRERNGKKLILVLYVDDGLVAATDPHDQEELLQELKTEFRIVSKSATYFLGIEIEQIQSGIKIHQKAYAERILERFNFSCCKPISTPMLKSSEAPESRKDDISGHNFPYRQAVGALMYLMLCTRPDLAYSIGFLSRSLENPSIKDVTRVKRVFRYIAGTVDQGITYKCNVNKGILECYSDADFGGCTNTGRSTTGVVVIYAGGAISWLSQRQTMVATSTTEAEIVAANEASKEIIWLTRLFTGIISLQEVPILQVDNSAAVRLAQNPEFHRRTKHIAMKHFFIRERVLAGKLEVQQIPTEAQLADIMTKPLPRTRLKILCDRMGLK